MRASGPVSRRRWERSGGREKKKDNLLRVMKPFCLIPKQRPGGATRVGGWRQRRALQHTVAAARVDASTAFCRNVQPTATSAARKEVKKAASLKRDFFHFD